MAVRTLLAIAVLREAVIALTQLVAQHGRHGLERLVASGGRHGHENAASYSSP